MLSAYGRILDPSRTIKDQGLHNGQCIDVLIKGLGGGRSGEGTGESLHTHACQLLLSPGDSSMYYYNSHINLIMFDVSLAFPQPPIACCIRSTAAQLCLCQWPQASILADEDDDHSDSPMDTASIDGASGSEMEDVIEQVCYSSLIYAILQEVLNC